MLDLMVRYCLLAAVLLLAMPAQAAPPDRAIRCFIFPAENGNPDRKPITIEQRGKEYRIIGEESTGEAILPLELLGTSKNGQRALLVVRDKLKGEEVASVTVLRVDFGKPAMALYSAGLRDREAPGETPLSNCSRLD